MTDESDVRREPPDVPFARTCAVGAATIAVFLGLLLISAALLSYFGGAGESVAAPLPADPVLETESGRQLRELRAREDRELSQGAWVDRDAGIVRIPIERAIERLVEKERGR